MGTASLSRGRSGRVERRMSLTVEVHVVDPSTSLTLKFDGAFAWNLVTHLVSRAIATPRHCEIHMLLEPQSEAHLQVRWHAVESEPKEGLREAHRLPEPGQGWLRQGCNRGPQSTTSNPMESTPHLCILGILSRPWRRGGGR